MTKIYITQQPVEGMFRLNREYRKRLVKVMRLKAGDSLLVITSGKKWECRIQQILPDEIVLQIEREIETPNRPLLHLILAQAIPKGDRFEWLIQKSTELGVAEIFPLISERTVVKPANITGKVQRWNEISEQAAGQSENGFPCLIHPPESLPSFLLKPINSQLKLLLHERKNAVPLRQVLAGTNDVHRIIFIVGPEGGWTETETKQMLSQEYSLIHLGPRILRAETSGLVMATLLQYELGDFRSTQ
jgi:16S rRNA (uracil1498-N3)-methyltransferase